MLGPGFAKRVGLLVSASSVLCIGSLVLASGVSASLPARPACPDVSYAMIREFFPKMSPIVRRVDSGYQPGSTYQAETCYYLAAHQNVKNGFSLRIDYEYPVTKTWYDQRYAQQDRRGPGGCGCSLKRVSGIGGAAFDGVPRPAGHKGQFLVFLDGTYLVSIAVANNGSLAPLESFARRLISG